MSNYYTNPLSCNDYTVVDTEFLSFAPGQPIYQVGLLRVRNRIPVDERSITINPRHKKSASDRSLNGLTDKELSKAPFIEDVIESIVEYIGDDCLVGFKVFTSDINKLSNAYFQKTGQSITNDYVDVMEVVKACNLPVPEFNQDAICNYLGLTENNHDALEDCKASYRIFEIAKMIPEREDENVRKKREQKRQNNHHKSYNPFKLQGKFDLFDQVQVNEGDIVSSGISNLKCCFSDCKIESEELAGKMKRLGIKRENLFDKVRKSDCLDYVVLPDPDHPTGKGADGIKYGVTLITPEEFEVIVNQEWNRIFGK